MKVAYKNTQFEDLALVDAARAACKNGYAPYSSFKVGAAVRVADGSIYLGSNMENASYGLSICAEVSAISAVSSDGKLSLIRSIAIIGGNFSEINNKEHVFPCGRCRQLIYEASELSSCDITVLCGGLHSKDFSETTIKELLPNAFGPRDLSKNLNELHDVSDLELR